MRLTGVLTRRGGFTLIEVMAVVVLIGLLAGATAWSMAGTVQRATRQETVDKLAHADATARMSARRLGSASLRIDLDTQRLWVVTPDLETDQPRPGHVVKLPPNYRVASVAWVDPVTRGRAMARGYEVRVRTQGQVELAVSSAGLGRSYVLEVVGPGTDPDDASRAVRDRPSWVLVSGLSGQVTVHDEQERIDKLLELLASARPDAG